MSGDIVGPGPAESPRQGAGQRLGAIEETGGIDARRPAQQALRSVHDGGRKRPLSRGLKHPRFLAGEDGGLAPRSVTLHRVGVARLHRDLPRAERWAWSAT